MTKWHVQGLFARMVIHAHDLQIQAQKVAHHTIGSTNVTLDRKSPITAQTHPVIALRKDVPHAPDTISDHNPDQGDFLPEEISYTPDGSGCQVSSPSLGR